MRCSSDAMTAGSVTIAGAGGDQIEAYLARPDASRPRGGVVVIHHMPGYDRATKEITRRFAELGYDAICPNLHWRDAPGAAPDDAAAASRANGGVPDSRLVGDVAGAAAFLRSLPTSNGRVGVIGYCSGGRQSVLAACQLELDAAVDCYGAFVTGEPPAGYPIRVTNLVDQLPGLRAPLLGPVRGAGREPQPGAGRGTGADPRRQRQGIHPAQLPGRRPRILRHRPGLLPGGGRERRVGTHRRLLRRASFLTKRS